MVKRESFRTRKMDVLYGVIYLSKGDLFSKRLSRTFWETVPTAVSRSGCPSLS